MTGSPPPGFDPYDASPAKGEEVVHPGTPAPGGPPAAPNHLRNRDNAAPRILRVDWGWFQLYVWPSHHGGWFRLFGWGFGVTDHRIDRPLFSERYNGRHGVKRRRYIHVGSLCLRSIR